MKDNLEYKILKYLSKNDNGEFIDISSLNENSKTLQSTIKDLKNNKLLESRKILTNGLNCVGRIDCRIVLKGKEYINNIDKEKTVGNMNDFRGATFGQFNQDCDFLDSPISIKTNAAPSNNPETKSRLIIILSNPWVIGIFLALLTAVLNGKIIMNFINNILEKI